MKCTLNDEQLIDKCLELVNKLTDLGGRSWVLNVPFDFDNNPDVLFTELGNRLRQRNESLKSVNKGVLSGNISTWIATNENNINNA